MHINILTLFPEWFDSPLTTALLDKARKAGLVEFSLLNPRDTTTDTHHTVDNPLYGDGPGMLMLLQPLVTTLRNLEKTRPLGKVVMLSASGTPFTQQKAREWAKLDNLTLICGRYEGIDARLPDIIPMEQVSVGEAVLNGGEVASMMIIEAVARLIPGFMGKEESGDEESFSDGLLEYPHYTHPANFEGHCVPEILQSGNHEKIAQWRREQSLQITLDRRPELLTNAPLTTADIEFLRERIAAGHCPGNTVGGNTSLGKNIDIVFVQAPVMLGWKETGEQRLESLTEIQNLAKLYTIAGIHMVGSAEQKDLAGIICDLTAKNGEPPFVIDAHASVTKKQTYLTIENVRTMAKERHILLVFATGFGLTKNDKKTYINALLRPVTALRGNTRLSASATAIIVLDRLLGDGIF